MSLPSIQLRPGVNIDEVIHDLRTIGTNAYGQAMPVGPPNPVDRQAAYVKWATAAERGLRSVLPQSEITKLFSGARHRDICSMTPGAQILPMISAEVDDQTVRFENLASEFERARSLFKGPDLCVLPDSSFYIEHPEQLEKVNIHELAKRQGSVRVLVPMVVIDELDGLKRASSREVRWRAGYSLALIDRVVSDPPRSGLLRERTSLPRPPRGEVTIQIIFDPPNHRRLPINDDEIVDRAVACQLFAEKVTIVTYDTGQSTRARAAGLQVMKLSHDRCPESAAT